MASKDTTYVGAQIPNHLHETLLKLALKEDRTLSAIIRMALCEYAATKQKESK